MKNRSLWLILGTYILLAVACSVINPIFEAPDEHHHYDAARLIATTKQLPVATGDTVARQEAAQPPLYYLLSALILAPIDTVSAQPRFHSNPNVDLGRFDSVNNVNAFAHTPEEAWPWSGHMLAVHAVRFLSIALGLGTLVCIHATGRLLWPSVPHRALLATALVAFLPQFIFLHSAITNDTLIIFFCSAALWQMTRLWIDKVTPWRLFILGGTIGLAALSKTTGLLLLPLSAAELLLLAWQERDWRQLAKQMILLIVPVVLASGWMYWRNWSLYGDLFAVNVFVEHAGGDRHFTIKQAMGDLNRVWQSSIAVFGWMNLTAPTWVYMVWKGMAALGLFGLAMKGLRTLVGWLRTIRRDGFTVNLASRSRQCLLVCLLAMWPLLVFGARLQFAMRTPADQGRLLFPAILPVSLALAHSLSQLGRRWSYPVASVLALITSVYCIFFLLPQAYAQPAIIQEADIPPEATRLNHIMGLGLELIASEVGTLSTHPGDTVDLTLYWRSQGTAGTAPIVITKVLGREYAQIGGLPGAYHGGGIYPSTLWPPNGIIKERVRLPLVDEITTPTEGRLVVELAGQEGLVSVGSIKVVPPAWPKPSQATVAELGKGVALTDASLGATRVPSGATIPVLLHWQISQPPDRDLTTLVHLGDPTQPPIAQADAPAVGGDYPSRLWDAGESFDDLYLLQLPADIPGGHYPVHVGLYDPLTGLRVPVRVDGVRQPYDVLLVGWITVE